MIFPRCASTLPQPALGYIKANGRASRARWHDCALESARLSTVHIEYKPGIALRRHGAVSVASMEGKWEKEVADALRSSTGAPRRRSICSGSPPFPSVSIFACRVC